MLHSSTLQFKDQFALMYFLYVVQAKFKGSRQIRYGDSGLANYGGFACAVLVQNCLYTVNVYQSRM